MRTVRAMLLAPVALAMAEDAAEARAAIEAAMADSAQGWNAGDVDRFLAIYSDDPATSFTGAQGVERGKAGIRARYLVTYASQFGGGASAPPTTLSFVFEDFRMIGADHALLIARWKLSPRGAGESAQTGMTSLVFRREGGGWKIVADHSS
ncbi:nuclear transport factor 2 family protein [Sphingomonas canadensis]|uniref:Nuclear transport factor 2 family protein n=1 Tax=Sphingomonas canadensis TaxID=1219257 RepID=A0ABW3HEJ0_9SPHN|nr:nuclear transport factor 2 family protein [Sphingomonas canadensis]MCW3837782.1 nuclear transport factor 2 family protein [Sphingomonas canadensis]